MYSLSKALKEECDHWVSEVQFCVYYAEMFDLLCLNLKHLHFLPNLLLNQTQMIVWFTFLFQKQTLYWGGQFIFPRGHSRNSSCVGGLIQQ